MLLDNTPLPNPLSAFQCIDLRLFGHTPRIDLVGMLDGALAGGFSEIQHLVSREPNIDSVRQVSREEAEDMAKRIVTSVSDRYRLG